MGKQEIVGVGHSWGDLPDETRPEDRFHQTGEESASDAVGTMATPRSCSRDLVPVPTRPQGEWADGPRVGVSQGRGPSRFAFAAAAALAIVAAVAGALATERWQQGNILAERAKETESLAQTVRTLKVRLDAIESATGRDDLADLRRSIGDMKSAAVSTHEFNGALSQLSQRVDKLDHEASAKVDKLNERVDHESSALNTDLSARLDRLEKKVVTPVLAQASPQTPTPSAQTKQPSIPPRFGPNVSMEETGSIERPRPLLRGYIVLDARDDVALVGGRFGEREVRLGDFLPGAGRVERIERKGQTWVVLTSEGLIPAAEYPPF